MIPGSVVEYLLLGQASSGVLLGAGAREHRVLGVDGKEHAVPRGRVVDISSLVIGNPQHRHDMVILLHAIEQEREALKAAIDLDTLWEITAGTAQPWSLEELTALYYHGDFAPHGKAALFRALLDGGYFRRDGLTFMPSSRETVEAHRQQMRRSDSEDAWLREIGAWLRRAVDEQSLPEPAPPNTPHALELLAARVLFGPAHPDARDADRIADAGHFHSREAIINALATVGYWDRNENLDLLRFNTPTIFTDQVIGEAKAARWRKYAREAKALSGRRVYAFMARNGVCEQAFSLRTDHYGFTLGIHLASPPQMMRAGAALQWEAEERAVALMLPERTIPLLPEELTERFLLTTAKYRPCLTLFIRFRSDGTLEHFHFALRRVQITHPLQYDTIDDRHDGNLRKLYELALQLRRQRQEAGAILLNEPEIEVQVADEAVTGMPACCGQARTID